MKIEIAQHRKKSIILGTAMWAWTIDREQCFQLMDAFYATGFRQVDTATNYPINKEPAKFRAAENLLLEWIATHGVTDLQVIQKVGSVNNLRSPENNLSKSFLLINLDDYRHRFGSNLHTFMIHWDNRQDQAAILESMEALQTANENGIQIGLSGIKHPEVYRELNKDFQFNFRIQIKHNLLHSDYERYQVLHDQAEFLAYGLNAGGMKLDPKRYTQRSGIMARGGPPTTQSVPNYLHGQLPEINKAALPQPITNFNQLGMINAFHHPGINSLIIGPSNTAQLQDSLDFFSLLQQGEYEKVYEHLQVKK